MNKARLSKIIHSIKFKHQTITNISHPTERKTWKQYKALFVTPHRIKNGVKFYNENKVELKEAQKQFNVSPYVITAIAGVETNYGSSTGNDRLLDSLGTLAFTHKARKYFFQTQLEAFILLAEKKHLFNVLSIKGSYAGAFGIPQFMPTSYIKYSVRYKNDNKPSNLFNAHDAIMSIANYLHKHNWKKNVFIEKKITTHQAKKLKRDNLKGNAVINLNTGNSNKDYRLISPNFKAIMSYNPRYNYAMAVASLSYEIKTQSNGNKHGRT